MQRSEALKLLKQYVASEKMIIHCLESEAVLRALARRLGEDQEKWALAGLLHDIDIEIIGNDMMQHGLKAVEMLKEEGIDTEIIDAIKMHNEVATGLDRSSRIQHALAAGETITGLIHATALVYPDKRIDSVKVKSITKRMKERAFAASVNRNTIMECEKLGLSLDEFTSIALDAMKEIHEVIGL